MKPTTSGRSALLSYLLTKNFPETNNYTLRKTSPNPNYVTERETGMTKDKKGKGEERRRIGLFPYALSLGDLLPPSP
jgi:hypothetical protein